MRWTEGLSSSRDKQQPVLLEAIAREMVQIFVKGVPACPVVVVEVAEGVSCADVCFQLSEEFEVPIEEFFLQSSQDFYHSFDYRCQDSHQLSDGTTVSMKMRVCGGIDFQHREGGKTGGGGQLSESQAALERKERLRKLALETIDITKDPYFLRNHLGTFECKLCLTLHPNEVGID